MSNPESLLLLFSGRSYPIHYSHIHTLPSPSPQHTQFTPPPLPAPLTTLNRLPNTHGSVAQTYSEPHKSITITTLCDLTPCILVDMKRLYAAACDCRLHGNTAHCTIGPPSPFGSLDQNLYIFLVYARCVRHLANRKEKTKLMITYKVEALRRGRGNRQNRNRYERKLKKLRTGGIQTKMT
jgi:hypothetical protein